MKAKEFHRMIETGENSQLEFKTSVRSPEVVARVVSAFLNSQGGQLVIGVSENLSLIHI